MGSDTLTVTDVVADEFCPLFTYFGHVLGLPQNAERRGTVQAGHAHHGRHERSNRKFVPSGIGGGRQGAPERRRGGGGEFVPASLSWGGPAGAAQAKAPLPASATPQKLVGLMLSSERLGIVGKVDEAVVVGGEAVLIERKYSDLTRVTPARAVQAGLLAMLLEESLGVVVRRARFVFTKSRRVTVEVAVDEGVRQAALRALRRARRTIQTGIMPESRYDARCHNCCYRRVCPVGSLYTER